MADYVHGYSAYEAGRLLGSADTLSAHLHARTAYPAGSLVLEAGCGVGAQTGHLRARSPGARIISADISGDSLKRARANSAEAPFVRADLHALPFATGVFNHVFVCFVLEHLDDPAAALRALSNHLRPGGTLRAIEGDHGSAFFHPETEAAKAAWACLQRLQLQTRGDGHLGRRLYALMRAAGFQEIEVRPIPIYCDPTLPRMMEGFADKTIVGMLRGIEEEVLARGLIPPDTWRQGLADLLAIRGHPEGAFSYTFFEACVRA